MNPWLGLRLHCTFLGALGRGRPSRPCSLGFAATSQLRSSFHAKRSAKEIVKVRPYPMWCLGGIAASILLAVQVGGDFMT